MKLILGDCLERMAEIEDGSVDLTVTSPPYNIGKPYEKVIDIQSYLLWQRDIIAEVYRTTKDGGSVCWQVGNFVIKGAVYPLDCLMFQIFLDIGFIPRNRIIWHFGHGLHCKNRFSGRHETIMWFTKGEKYTFNLDPVRIPSKYPEKKHYKGGKKGQLSGNPLGKNPDDVWSIPNVKHNHPEKTDHPCQFPEAIVERLTLSLSNKEDTLMDMFMGSGTTGKVSKQLGRNFIGIERDETYFKIAQDRIAKAQEDKAGMLF